MNKQLLLALIFIPLILGCENSPEAESSPAADIAAVIPGIQWEVIHYECKTDSSEENPEVIATGIDWDPIVITGTHYDQASKQYFTGIYWLDPNGEIAIFHCDVGDKGTIVLGY